MKYRNFKMLKNFIFTLGLVASAYELKPDIFHKRLPEFFNKMMKAEENDAVSIGMIIERIANKHPQV